MYFAESPTYLPVINDFWLTRDEAEAAVKKVYPRARDRELITIRLRDLEIYE